MATWTTFWAMATVLAAAAPPPAPAPHPLEKSFAQAEEAERAWDAECPVRESVAVGETRLLDLGAAKVLSEEVPIATVALGKAGKVRATGVGPGLTVLRLQKKKGQQLVCLRVTAPAGAPEARADLPSPGPCALPKATAALLVQSVALEKGVRLLLPMPGWKRFTVDDPAVATVGGTGPDELALEGKTAGKTRLKVCQGAKVEVIDLEVAAARPVGPGGALQK